MCQTSRFSKVHKPVTPQGHPQSRPVVTAASGLSSQAGDVLADFLEPVVNAVYPRFEDRSTGEVLSQLQEVKIKMQEEGLTDVTVGSLDISALYPSLNHKGSAETVYRLIMSSKMEFKGIDWRAAQVFLASNLSLQEVKDEGLEGLLPRRLKKKGVRPGWTTTELSVKRPDPETAEGNDVGDPETKWAPTDPSKLSWVQKRHILARACQVAVRNVFAHHQYQFDGQTYKQSNGAPIKLRLTSIIAWAVMDEWMGAFMTRVEDAGMMLLALCKYIDDLNVVMMLLALGSRWEDRKITHSDENEEDDRRNGKSRDMVTLQCLKGAADSIVPWLKFTFDAPELHTTGMVPVLDLQVWIRRPRPEEEGLGCDLLAWMFFKKLVAAAKVMQANLPGGRRLTMVMEVYHRLRNSSRQLTLRAKVNLLQTFVHKMRISGYGMSTVKGIIECSTITGS